MKRDSMVTRLGTVVLGIVAALVLAEGVLQLGAFVVRNRARSTVEDSPGERDGRVVLCIGDSFTYGSGSSSAATSYPGQLQSWLGENAGGGPTWSVRNAGWPGRNSSELARRLPRFLAETQPDYVCVLTGLNNRWNRKETDLPLPEPGAVAEAPSEVDGAWRWRLPRLLAIVGAAVRERSAEGDAVRAPADVAPASALSIDTRDPAAGLEELWAFRAEASDVGPLLDTLQVLRPRVREMRDPAVSARLVLLLSHMSRYEDAVEEGTLAIEEHGRTPALADALVRSFARLDRLDEAIEMGRFAVDDAPLDAERLRNLGVALRIARQPEEALRVFTRAFAVTGDHIEYEKQLRKLRARPLIASPERCEKALAELELAPDRREAVLASLETVRGEKTMASIEDLLLRDLHNLKEQAEAAGAELVLLTYPSNRTASPVLRQYAEETGVPIADVEPVLSELIEAEGRERYLIPDGHCNDRGYGVMAELAGKMILNAEKGRAGER